mgnify:CR=1
MKAKTKLFVEAEIDIIKVDTADVVTSSETDVKVPDSGTWTPRI